LVVTGTEPRATNLSDEPYWPDFARLVDWAGAHTGSTIWSCLAAHGAVLHADGVERQPREHKLFGVFTCDRAVAHPLLAGVLPRICVPHSRYNDLPEAALASCGYRVLTRSTDAGVDSFVRRQRDGSMFVFFQGHPEYEADTLAREYRRDVARFLRGERERYPEMPENYFNGEAAAHAAAFRTRATRERDQNLIAEFPMHRLEVGIANTWNGFAAGIYANWIKDLKDFRAEQHSSVIPLRRSRRKTWPRGNVRPAADGSAAG